MNTTETDNPLLAVCRDNIFEQIEKYVIAHGKVPTTNQLSRYFAAPKSAAIAVYLTEWKELNRKRMVGLRSSMAQWKAHAEGLESELTQAKASLDDVQQELAHLKDFLARKHWSALEEWEAIEFIPVPNQEMK